MIATTHQALTDGLGGLREGADRQQDEHDREGDEQLAP